MTFVPTPYRLSPETVAARKQKRANKLNQSFDDTVAEVRRERQQLKWSSPRSGKVTRNAVTGRFVTRRLGA